jgi:TPR repeat protein
MKPIVSLITILLLSLFSSPSWSEKFTAAWVEDNEITLEKLVEISNKSTSEDKFKISQLLDFGGWLFEGEKTSTIDATRSVILHEAAALGHARAQFILSLDYEQGVNGFSDDNKLAELWLKKAMQNGYKTDSYHSKLDRFKNQRAYKCDTNIQTVTGISKTETTRPDWSFGLLYEYGNFNLFYLDSPETMQFRCGKTTLLSEIGPYLQTQCVRDTLGGSAEYFVTADDRSGNKVGLSDVIPYSWVLGLPELLTIRQGNCFIIKDFSFD